MHIKIAKNTKFYNLGAGGDPIFELAHDMLFIESGGGMKVQQSSNKTVICLSATFLKKWNLFFFKRVLNH